MPLFDMQRLVNPELVRLDRKRNAKARVRSAILVTLFLIFAGLLISTVYRYAAWRNAYIASLPEQHGELVSIAATENSGRNPSTYIITMVSNGERSTVELTALMVPDGGEPDGGVRAVIVYAPGEDPGFVRFRLVEAAVPFPGLGLIKLQPGIYDLWAYTCRPIIQTE